MHTVYARVWLLSNTGKYTHIVMASLSTSSSSVTCDLRLYTHCPSSSPSLGVEWSGVVPPFLQELCLPNRNLSGGESLLTLTNSINVPTTVDSSCCYCCCSCCLYAVLAVCEDLWLPPCSRCHQAAAQPVCGTVSGSSRRHGWASCSCWWLWCSSSRWGRQALVWQSCPTGAATAGLWQCRCVARYM